MREILFRGKTADGSKWIYGNYQKLKICGDIVHLIQPFQYDTYRGETIDENTLCQYTGFHDINGSKIFEGDIVLCTYKNREFNQQMFAICEYDDINPCFVLRDIDNKYNLEYDFVKCDLLELEVVDNIYDNKEFLR